MYEIATNLTEQEVQCLVFSFDSWFAFIEEPHLNNSSQEKNYKLGQAWLFLLIYSFYYKLQRWIVPIYLDCARTFEERRDYRISWCVRTLY